jgi:hypothetical protein
LTNACTLTIFFRRHIFKLFRDDHTELKRGLRSRLRHDQSQ